MAEHPDHDYTDDGFWIDCWQCGGEGVIARCISDYACIDPEDGCEYCLHPCDICHSEGGWHGTEPADG